MNEVTFSAGALVIISGLLSTLVGGMVALFKLLLAAKDHEITAVTTQRDSYEKLANQSVSAMEAAVNRGRLESGQAPFTTIPPVVPQHNSPITSGQQYDADLETLKARAAAARRALGIEPGDEPV
jgi:hypothetical protein